MNDTRLSGTFFELRLQITEHGLHWLREMVNQGFTLRQIVERLHMCRDEPESSITTMQ